MGMAGMFLTPAFALSLLATTGAKAQITHQWRSLDADEAQAVFFDQNSLKKVGPDSARATFAIAWKQPDDAVYPTFRIRNVSVVEEVFEGDCKAGTIAVVDRIYYSESGERLLGVRAAVTEPKVPKSPSTGMEILNLLCGGPQLLGAEFDVGAAGLVKIVRESKVMPKNGAPTP
ncbi:MAG: hypothetical protein CFE28_16435 [Alphaproteobacteria bacterium PA2]|nr:MAG: hypothetical protein CFE28_16435 [Alphaproteobacteria bacterium PA2]